jgi:hypothetical protein
MTYSQFIQTQTYKRMFGVFSKAFSTETSEDVMHAFYTAVCDERGEDHFEYYERAGTHPYMLLGSFNWEDSMQGHHYWQLVNQVYQFNF